MIFLLILILLVLLYIVAVLRTIAGNQLQTALNDRAQRAEMLNAIRKVNG